MEKRKKLAPVWKKPTIKIPARPACKMAAMPIDESTDCDELLEFPELPAPSMSGNAERVGQLSKADWAEEKVLEEEEDGKEELDQLEAEPRPEEECGSDQSIEITDVDAIASASGPALTFINVDSMSFNAPHKRKWDSPDQADLVSAAGESLLGPSLNKYKYNKFVPQGCLTDEAINRMLTGKKKSSVTAKGKGKSTKASVAVSDTSEDEESDAPRRFTVYVQVWCKIALAEKKLVKGAKASTTIVSWGPFKMDTTRTFQSFKQDIANFEWKFENQAQSAPCKKIADEAGYEALLDAVKPAKDEQDWDTGDPDYVEHPFNFEEETGVASRTMKSLIAAGRADMSAPPTTNHFVQKLKVPRPPPDAPILTFGEFYHHRQWEQTLEGAGQEPVPPQPTHGHVIPPLMPLHPHGQYGPLFPGPLHLPGPSHQFFHPSQYMLPPYIGRYPYPLPYHPAAQGHGQLTGEVPSASSSPGLTTSHDISLSEFCVKYHILDNDQAKLAALKYQPGN
ncbi:uncharacterized protein BJ212DRAFT_1485777 [Suillus subaureus]|uniref:Uncharacterized protein n=1 Tax=Suillus subaureus TaxID=48587 RepID=A0A9P7J806_9AGAM|nr:uncharacterized protein BJ212DRAFT_1485777 [Suillus subaureus]KAG1807121.1 hypothetical protein BJ212DRAFT_1485777 [Suillus subaureus]